VAGFIGSHLAEALVELGHNVIGVDNFSPYYDPAVKRDNLASLMQRENFSLRRCDVNSLTIRDLPGRVDMFFHLAGQPGVRGSWGTNFEQYLHANVAGTRAALDLAQAMACDHFVLASSSSVYGGCTEGLSIESDRLRPLSPYGVSKVAAEQLCYAYSKEFLLPTTVLRYFSVYGPRQRPDMAFHKFLRAACTGEPVQIFGSLGQSRDYTFVMDVVDATIRAAELDGAFQILNIASGKAYTLAEVVATMESVTDVQMRSVVIERQAGDPFSTGADISLAHKLLEYMPKTSLREGLTLQWASIAKTVMAATGIA
jgi:nucleoside-diphosphate-sugar epimerase